MGLVEQGKIDRDAPSNSYLGDACLTSRVGDPAEVSVRQVANHSAGLPLHFQFFYDDEDSTRPPFEDYYQDQEALDISPEKIDWDRFMANAPRMVAVDSLRFRHWRRY